MKFLKFVFITLLLVALAAAAGWFFAGDYISKIPSLKQYNIPTPSELLEDAQDDTLIEHAKKHSDPNYVCPMHPQIVQGEPGNCPICGMDLVKKEPPKPKAGKEKKILYWVAPMDANYRRDEPGKSPMGMDLVPVYEKAGTDTDDNDGYPRISIDPTVAQNMGIRTQKTKKTKLSRTIHTVGSVGYNEDTLRHIHPRANGWVERVFIKAEGDKVKRGSALLEIYSPDLVAAQKDLLIAKQSGQLFSQRGTTSLLESAKEKMRLLDIPESIIKRVASSGKSQDRIPILSPDNGIVIRMGIRDGMYVTPTTEMYAIADLSTVWVLVDVFEHQSSWVKVGNRAEIKVKGIPGKTWKGKVDYIYPELDKMTRTLRVRLKFSTPGHLLKPNMFADVTLFAKSVNTLTVPSEAIIYYENSPRVVKVLDDRQYQPVEVKTGMKSQGQVEILSGLKEGDKILVSGQFMIDSESNLQASFRRLTQ
jgi:Cu(I)/Ag(I) efflux system membrane fusion protein